MSSVGTNRTPRSPTPDFSGESPDFAQSGASYDLHDLLSGLEALGEDGAPIPHPAEATARTAPRDEARTVAAEDGEWDASILSAEGVVAALHALADDETVKQPAATPQEPEAAARPPGTAAASLAAQVEAIIAGFVPDGRIMVAKGSTDLPEDLDALARLLSDPPLEQDFAALDALYACWPRGTQDSDSRALLAVALNLTRMFGLPGKLPMASTRAWRMLSTSVFEAELAQRLRDIDTFIEEWQRTQRTFLILDFSEMELSEYLFEALHPGIHAELLAKVMNFKVLSNRRMGLLRRIPTRLKKTVMPLLPAGHEQALVELAHAKLLLEMIAGNGFAPIADAAGKALEEVEKMMKAAANAGAPQLPPGPPGGGMPLGRIG